jgi:hypothetical protein
MIEITYCRGRIPEIKEVKQLVRDRVAPGRSLGHTDAPLIGGVKLSNWGRTAAGRYRSSLDAVAIVIILTRFAFRRNNHFGVCA